MEITGIRKKKKKNIDWKKGKKIGVRALWVLLNG